MTYLQAFVVGVVDLNHLLGEALEAVLLQDVKLFVAILVCDGGDRHDEIAQLSAIVLVLKIQQLLGHAAERLGRMRKEIVDVPCFTLTTFVFFFFPPSSAGVDLLPSSACIADIVGRLAIKSTHSRWMPRISNRAPVLHSSFAAQSQHLC
ncbi:hypothetical protein PR202_ga27362 [Eleusine coracana subsp. coracana]|uniref:Secreted protein n=1 Tax=Eleusine coracana subsp. coracana TaxID=191504 RepID=A0AAV5DG05_ELECO|nr:hypothetical protein PR202_ga27362 [Eleusine coracana subsp. coracana]